MVRCWFLLILILVSPSLWAMPPLPTQSLVPGGVAVVDLGALEKAPKAYLGKKALAISHYQNHYYALVGISLQAKTGLKTIKINVDGKTHSHSFEVVGKDYPQQWLTIKNQRHVNPNPADLKRIKQENSQIWRAKNSFSPREPITAMQLPTKGIYSSGFGLQRFFNKQPRKPHAGLDIAAPRHTPIYAAADGVVTEAHHFFFSGNCVFIEHGQGVTSFYAHMHSINVKKGQEVKAGELIGTVGDTGRVTGPHLHFSIGLNGTWVDPALFLAPKDRPKK